MKYVIIIILVSLKKELSIMSVNMGKGAGVYAEKSEPKQADFS